MKNLSWVPLNRLDQNVNNTVYGIGDHDAVSR